MQILYGPTSLRRHRGLVCVCQDCAPHNPKRRHSLIPYECVTPAHKSCITSSARHPIPLAPLKTRAHTPVRSFEKARPQKRSLPKHHKKTQKTKTTSRAFPQYTSKKTPINAQRKRQPEKATEPHRRTPNSPVSRNPNRKASVARELVYPVYQNDRGKKKKKTNTLG